MRILVTGAKGQVGHELLRALSACAAASAGPASPGDGSIGRASQAQPGFTTIAATRDGRLGEGAECKRIDLDDLDGLPGYLDRIAPDLIVNAAAYTAVDRAEDEPDLAMRINAEAVGVIGAWAAAHRARVVHYSTDYVFDGSATRPYREDDATHPLGAYGRSKLAGEDALRDSGARHLVLRTAWVYGARGRNFLRTMLRLGAERDELRVVDDQVGAPTSAGLIADVTAQVVARWLAAGDHATPVLDGTYNLVAAGQTSWCGFARAIFERASPGAASGGAGESLSGSRPGEGRRDGSSARVIPIRSADFPTKARRPAFSVLDTTKLRATFGVELPHWQAALDDVMRAVEGG